MTRTLNKVLLVGNVGKDPELRYTSGDIPVVTFRMATTDVWRDKDNNLKEHTDWHTITAWRGLAEVIHKIVKKGSKVFVEGKLQSRTFDDKNGQRKQVVEILADNILLLEYKKYSREDHEFGEDMHLNGHQKYGSPFEDTITDSEPLSKISDLSF